MDSVAVSEAVDPGSTPGARTIAQQNREIFLRGSNKEAGQSR